MLIFAALNLLLTISIIIKLFIMTELETTEFANLNTKLDALKTGLDTAVAALATAKSDLAAIQATVSDADVVSALQAAEAKVDTANAEIAAALTPPAVTA